MSIIIMTIAMVLCFYIFIKAINKNITKIEKENSQRDILIQSPEFELEADEQIIVCGKKSSSLASFRVTFVISLIASLVFGIATPFLIGEFGWDPMASFFLILEAICLVITAFLGINLFSYSKSEIAVTTQRIYGTTRFGKCVNLPVDSVTAVGVSWLFGIDVSTPSGYICFKFIQNNVEVQAAISKLLSNRQVKKSAHSAPSIVNAPISNADELKKYKELLDIGIITQEEFEAKKKQLLGL